MAQYLDGKIITRNYSELRGVDFSSDETLVSLHRSPYALNVYKDYKSSLGQAVETRPGFRILKHFDAVMVSGVPKRTKVIKTHKFAFDDRNYFIVQINEFDEAEAKYEGKLYRWANYPAEPAELVDMEYLVGEAVGDSFYFGGNYYILDGTNIHKVKEIENEGAYSLSVAGLGGDAFVPTTYTISASGTGIKYQEFNTLTGWQKNEFEGNGTEKIFQIRPNYTDRDIAQTSPFAVEVKVDGLSVTPSGIIYSHSDTNFGKVTLETAPASSAIIVIKFYQTPVPCEALACDKAIIYDNRVFLGNGADKNKYWWCALNDMNYIPATNFEYAGNEDLEVSNMVLMPSAAFVIIKKGMGQSGYIYAVSSITTGADTMAKAYPNLLVASSIGAYAGAINFLNDVVFVSKQGLKAIGRLDIHNERNIEHRSSLVDGKLTNEVDFANAQMAVFRGYLFILVNGRLYLADSRQTYKNSVTQSTEYEWYFWDNIGVYEDGEFYKAILIEEHDDRLFIGTENGCLCVLNADMFKMRDANKPTGNGELISSAYQDDMLVTVEEELTVEKLRIYSCWTTPYDEFEYRNYFKRCNKKGAMADLKSFSHSACTLAINTNYVKYTDLKRHNGGYFDFSDIDFGDFTFSTSERNTFYFKPKDKKWERISLKFYSGEIRKPFGIFGVTLEAILMGYAKESN